MPRTSTALARKVDVREQESGKRFQPYAIVGDSMAPTFMPGDSVVVDTADTSPSPPGPFLMWDGMALVVKRVEVISRSPGRVRVWTDNPLYNVYEFPLSQLDIRGRVIGRWRLL